MTQPQTKPNYSVLFVCLGNICRSPLAEGVFRHLTVQGHYDHLFLIDSCGTGHWHIGSPPHKESVRVASKHGISLSGQRARQLEASDFSIYRNILALDRENLRDIEQLRKESGATCEPCTVKCLREFDSDAESLDVPDPYYGGPDGFEEVYRILYRSCTALLAELLKEPGRERDA